MEKKVLITVGGTGGHVYPALTLAKQLRKIKPNLQMLFAGGGLSKNRYFEKESFLFQDIACGPLSIRDPVKSIMNSWNILRGVSQAYRILHRFSPDVVVGFGSYHTFPMLLAAKLKGIPIILHEANRIPGKVNRLLSRYVEVTGIHFPDTAKRLSGKTLEIPIPLREGFRKGTIPKAKACAYYNLDPNLITLLVFGGSQGAQAINRLVMEAIVKLSKMRLQVLHFTGDAITAQQVQEAYEHSHIRACVKMFETHMNFAWQAADLLISRSGAGTLAEELEFEVPGILIPYPHAMDNHQESNADFMVDVVGGAVKYRERDLKPDVLAQAITDLIPRIEEMRDSMRHYKKQTDRLQLCDLVCEALNQR